MAKNKVLMSLVFTFTSLAFRESAPLIKRLKKAVLKRLRISYCKYKTKQ